MSQETVILLGHVSGRKSIERLLAEFGWALESATTMGGLTRIGSRSDVVAVLIDPVAIELPWKRALAAVRREAPHALPVLCHPFSDPIEWTEASAEGAFHLLGLPLNLSELRQSLGFVWAERNQRANKVVALDSGDRSRLRKDRARGHVA